MKTFFHIVTLLAVLAACGNLGFGYLTFFVCFIAGGIVLAQLRA